jgi:hypothetical protein
MKCLFHIVKPGNVCNFEQALKNVVRLKNTKSVYEKNGGIIASIGNARQSKNE